MPPTQPLPDCLTALRTHLINGLENPYGVKGRLVWHVYVGDQVPYAQDDINSWGLTIDLAQNEVASWVPCQLDTSHADAWIHMPFDVGHLLADEIHIADYRDPRIMGRTHVGGDLNLVNHMAKALLSPGPDARDRLDWATKREAPAYQVTHIERLHQPTELTLLSKIAQGLPFVATGLVPESACGEWSLERLSETFGPVPLRVRSAEHKETVHEFVQRVQQQLHADPTQPVVEGFTKAYTEGCTLPNAMRAHFMPHRFTLDDYIEPQIWLGAVPTHLPASSLHRDPLDGFLFQLMGRKKLVLYSPEQAPLLYPMKAWNNYQPCWVEPTQPRPDLFPEFAKARPLEVVLHPGELLIQPAGWFHAVYCLDSPTFSVSYFLRH